MQHAASASGVAEQKCHIFMCLRHYFGTFFGRTQHAASLQRTLAYFDTPSYSAHLPILTQPPTAWLDISILTQPYGICTKVAHAVERNQYYNVPKNGFLHPIFSCLSQKIAIFVATYHATLNQSHI